MLHAAFLQSGSLSGVIDTFLRFFLRSLPPSHGPLGVCSSSPSCASSLQVPGLSSASPLSLLVCNVQSAAGERVSELCSVALSKASIVSSFKLSSAVNKLFSWHFGASELDPHVAVPKASVSSSAPGGEVVGTDVPLDAAANA